MIYKKFPIFCSTLFNSSKPLSLQKYSEFKSNIEKNLLQWLFLYVCTKNSSADRFCFFIFIRQGEKKITQKHANFFTIAFWIGKSRIFFWPFCVCVHFCIHFPHLSNFLFRLINGSCFLKAKENLYLFFFNSFSSSFPLMLG